MEFVYVVKRRDLFPRSTPHGLELLEPAAMAAIDACVRRHGFFVERRHAERDSSLKQIIPYCLVVRGVDVFLMRRLAAGGEARLHGKRSVGVGGHINPVDGTAAGDDVVAEGLRREVAEELFVDGDWSARTVGLLNDDSTDVGSVHVGLVSVVSTSADVRVRETDVLEGSFVSADALRQMVVEERATFETWSALVLDHLDTLIP